MKACRFSLLYELTADTREVMPIGGKGEIISTYIIVYPRDSNALGSSMGLHAIHFDYEKDFREKCKNDSSTYTCYGLPSCL